MAGTTLLASAARTATGVGSSVPGFGDKTTLRVQLDVTAASGTAPTLNVVVEDTIDGNQLEHGRHVRSEGRRRA